MSLYEKSVYIFEQKKSVLSPLGVCLDMLVFFETLGPLKRSFLEFLLKIFADFNIKGFDFEYKLIIHRGQD